MFFSIRSKIVIIDLSTNKTNLMFLKYMEIAIQDS